MKRIVLIIAVFCFSFWNNDANAQMAAATKTDWNITERWEVPVGRDSVWTLLKDESKVAKLSNGYVLSVVSKDDIMPVWRETSFKDGQKRQELLSQLDEQHRFLVVKFKDESLPKGIKFAQFAVFTKELSDNRTEISWLAKIEGDADAKAQLVQQLTAEITAYKAGYLAYFKPKSVPMMRMN